jgi:para-aminobenzoate synthetase component I
LKKPPLIGFRARARIRFAMTHAAQFRYVHPNGPIIEEHAWVDPEAAFAPHADKFGAVWLDSSDTQHQAAQYSFIAIAPYQTTYQIEQLSGINAALQAQQALWDALPAEIDQWLPTFRGGLAGFFGYDMGRQTSSFDSFHLGFYDTVLAFDHAAKRCFIIATGLPETTTAARADRAHSQIAFWRQNLIGLPSAALPDPDNCPALAKSLQSNFTDEAYQAAVQQVIDHILDGDIFQANLAQCFTAQLNPKDTAFGYYQRLRRASPAPFSGFACFNGWSMASASPERFLQARHRQIETRPIKGTEPRGATKAEDQAIAQRLMASEKDRAENIMIVDLLRNDLAKSCRDHSIEVPELCVLESFSNVHHLVSTVRGHLADDKSPLDALLASFPGGSITGAPKIRAMEIIDALEPDQRGPSYGSLGYIGFDGTMDVNIIIRTALIRGQSLAFHVGGGIVADSQPQREYQETINKAGGLMAALGLSPAQLKPAKAS